MVRGISSSLGIKNNNVQFADSSTVNGDIGYSKILFKHIDRLLESSSVPGLEHHFLKTVRILDAVIEPDKDDMYYEDAQRISKSAKNDARLNGQYYMNNPDAEAEASYTYALRLFQAIMRLLKRKGYTPRTQIIDDL